ncbi:MAG TPA: ATP phosphoribosyltransferase [Gammaproteobacteria bacterium]|nr:ATP phosphoribosyltransferase [bacterium BMS3Abin11]GMT41081.1 MAG: ATP phosphoribosyltransferase [bacterium]HDH15966.1 ATP phosphoribosyltransferase [Gammaproteobacteria bacterium]HDZ78070.1 ATP phosphoribosyltransferase [Gammaproteobacteria bacterium]
MTESLTIALSKGRILNETLPLLAVAGIEPLDNPRTSRKLIFDTNQTNIRLVIIRAADVPTFVEFGAADLGVSGKDVLMEYDGNLFELLDLGIARCRLMVAEPAEIAANDDPANWSRLRIATKYVRIARRFFAAKGIQTEIIKLYGSMELAPLVGLADRIVDLVDTGRTLKANNLVEVEHIADISSWLVGNTASMKLKHELMQSTITAIAAALDKK